MIPESATIPPEEAVALIALSKFITGDLTWKESPKNSQFNSASFTVYGTDSLSITGLTVELEYRRGLVSSRCNYKFILRQSKGARKLRAYTIEVYAPDYRSHVDNGTAYYGPHEHIGETYVAFSGLNHLGCQDHEKWFQEFLKRGNITFSGKYSPPDPEIGQALLGV